MHWRHEVVLSGSHRDCLGRAGLYLCGAATHPGGSVIAINGRNAAMAVLEDAYLSGGGAGG